MDTQLDNRKITILKAIIKTYLETGEPVGSRTISKYSELKLSSATIRNEMSDLEEMGYIIQPHTSAGRIPSDKGYRFYVDQIMQEKDNEVTEFKDMMVQKVDKLELVLKKMAQVLAAGEAAVCVIHGGVTAGLMMTWFGGGRYDYSVKPGTGFTVTFRDGKPVSYERVPE